MKRIRNTAINGDDKHILKGVIQLYSNQSFYAYKRQDLGKQAAEAAILELQESTSNTIM